MLKPLSNLELFERDHSIGKFVQRCTLLLIGLVFFSPAWSAIEIGGSIETDTTLQAGETYHVISNLTINDGVTLTVPAATVLKADSSVSIQVINPAG